jgi:hypothetical protein
MGGVEGEGEAAVRDALGLIGEPDAWTVFGPEGTDTTALVYVLAGQTLHRLQASGAPAPSMNGPSSCEWDAWRITPEGRYSVKIERIPGPGGWLTMRSWAFEFAGGPVTFTTTSQHTASRHDFVKELLAAIDRA